MKKKYKPTEKVSARMRAVKRKDTGAEKKLATALKLKGHKFCKHMTIKICTPDIVFERAKLAVFVDGDFWHGRILLEKGSRAFNRSFHGPSKNFWITKITKNIARDLKQTHVLRRHGWSVCRVWERDILSNPEKIADQIISKMLKRSLL